MTKGNPQGGGKVRVHVLQEENKKRERRKGTGKGREHERVSVGKDGSLGRIG